MDKFTLLLDTIENPDSYSEADLEAMLQDPETMETFALLCKTKSSLIHITTPDMDKEWKNFENAHRFSPASRMRRLRAFFSRNIAATLAISILSFTAMATIAGLGILHIDRPEPDSHQVAAIAGDTSLMSSERLPDSVMSATEGSPAAEIIIFDNETFENIINEMAAYYGYSVAFKEDTPKSLRLYFRWDRTLRVEDVVARLNNFEHIHIIIEEKTINVD